MSGQNKIDIHSRELLLHRIINGGAGGNAGFDIQ